MKKRIISIIALLLILTTTFVACKDEPTTNEIENTAKPSDTTDKKDNGDVEEDTYDYSQDNTLADSDGIMGNSAIEKVGENSYKLTADITVEEVCTTKFTGTLDGNGKTVTTSAPLFLEVEGATFKNLTIAGTIDYSTEEYAVGGIAIAANGATLENLTNKATITGYSASGATLLFTAGGFIGISNGDIVATNCKNEGAITCGAEAGGILGYAETGTLTVTDCHNTGAIVSNFGGAGGLVGRSGDKSTGGTKAEIKNCTNTAAIKGLSHAGGIFGGLEGSKNDKFISNCVNTGDISGAKNVGGIGGKVKSGDTKNNREKTVEITLCGNSGNVTALSTEKYVNIYDTACFAGGIVGYIEVSGCAPINVTMCYTTGDISANRDYTDPNTPTGNENYAAGLFNGYQMRIKADADPANLALAGNNYATSYFSGNIISGKITAAENADGAKTALLFTDLAVGSWTWSNYNLVNFFGKNFYDLSVTGNLALVGPVTEYPALTFAAVKSDEKIAEGTLNTADFIAKVNAAIKADTKLETTTDIYAVGTAGTPVFVKA